MDATWLVATLLVAVRLGAMALVAPPLGGGMLPPTVRVAVVLALSGVLALSLPVGAAAGQLGLAQLLPAVLREAALGAFLALGLNMAFAIFTFGARLVDVQIGFAVGQVYDPLTHQQMPTLTAAYAQLATVGFFLLDGHHALMRGLAMSLEAVPLGQDWALASLLPAVVRQASQMFSLGFAMMVPVVFCLTLVELGLGFLSRNLPQLNVLVLGIPIKVVVGLVALALWAGSGAHMARAYGSAFTMWSALWR